MDQRKQQEQLQLNDKFLQLNVWMCKKKKKKKTTAKDIF